MDAMRGELNQAMGWGAGAKRTHETKRQREEPQTKRDQGAEAKSARAKRARGQETLEPKWLRLYRDLRSGGREGQLWG